MIQLPSDLCVENAPCIVVEMDFFFDKSHHFPAVIYIFFLLVLQDSEFYGLPLGPLLVADWSLEDGNKFLKLALFFNEVILSSLYFKELFNAVDEFRVIFIDVGVKVVDLSGGKGR